MIIPPVNEYDTSGKTYLALGDSYTIGQSVQPNERFAAQTVELMRAANHYMRAPEYIATTGWTTTDLLNAIAAKNPKGPYNLVSLLIGVNDQYQFGDTSNYRQRFIQLLSKAIELTGGKTANVFVLSIPDYSATPFASLKDTAAIRQQIEQFNTINKEVSISYNISYTFITDLTQRARVDKTLLATDGLHPSGKAYSEWAQLLAPKMSESIK